MAFKGLVKIAQDYAPGIPERENYGNIATGLKPGDIAHFALQHHDTVRRPGRPHYDMRLGTDATGMYSWALPKARLPQGKEKNLAVQTFVHRPSYNSFEGRIGKGYGAGNVKRVDLGKAVVTKVTPNTVQFTIGHTRVPTRYTLLKIKTETGKDWLLSARPKAGDVPGVGDKPIYKHISAVDQDDAIEQAAVVQEKIDGAHGIVNIGKRDDVDVFSVRPSVTGEPISHAERMGLFGTKAPGLGGNAYRGEMYFVDRQGKAVPFNDVSGILNRVPVSAIETWRNRKLKPRIALFDAVTQANKDVTMLPWEERQAFVRQALANLPRDIFHAPAEARTPEEKAKLVAAIREGKHPTTAEGVMAVMPDGSVRKIKNKLETTGYLTGTFPGEGKRQGTAGGLTFVTDKEDKGAPEGRVGTGFTDRELSDIVARLQELKGKPIRLEHMGQFGTGKLRAPSFKGFETDKAAEIVLDIEKGDTLLGGRFKNMKTVVEEIGTDELGQPTVNGKKLLSFRIAKKMPAKAAAADDDEEIEANKKRKPLPTRPLLAAALGAAGLGAGAYYWGTRPYQGDPEINNFNLYKTKFMLWHALQRLKGGKPDIKMPSGLDRIAIPKPRLNKPALKHLGYVPSLIAVPESGQSELTTFRHTDNNTHLHLHPRNWMMHQDAHTPLQIAIRRGRGKGILEALKGIGSGVAHFTTEGIPGMVDYLQNKATGNGNMEDKLPAVKSASGLATVRLQFEDGYGNVKASARVEIADTPASRRQGLSKRAQLGEHQGMFFDRAGTYWMKDTSFPLDIVFTDASGQVLGKSAMEVEADPSRPERYYPPPQGAVHAVELPLGFCDSNGIGIGDTVTASGE